MTPTLDTLLRPLATHGLNELSGGVTPPGGVTPSGWVVEARGAHQRAGSGTDPSTQQRKYPAYRPNRRMRGGQPHPVIHLDRAAKTIAGLPQLTELHMTHAEVA